MPEPRKDGTQALQGLQRIRSIRRLAALAPLTCLLGLLAGRAAGQERLPADTFRDGPTRALVERAIAARGREALGIESYEATLRQRMYVGMTAFRFRRERALFRHERVARVRWSADGERAIQWLGARTAVPVIGVDTGDPEATGGDARMVRGDLSVEVGAETREEEDDAEEYLDETEFPGFDFDPAADRLTLGSDWAYHPLADSSLVHYRYWLGDTLRVELPTNERSVVLYELRVEPRRADFRLVAGSLWVDSASAAVVRATYRPARAWSLRIDAPEDAGDVPGWVGAVEAEIEYITVESSLQELEYWLPRRFAFEGEARAGIGTLRMPITLEWSVGGYVVNEPPADVLVEGALPEGWRRRTTVEEDDDGTETRYTVIVPTTEELRGSPLLSADFDRRTPLTFTDAEVHALADDLEGLVPAYRPFPPHVAWGLEDGQLRFNRVEGLSVGLSTSVALGTDLSLDVSGRLGTGDRALNGAAALRRGSEAGEWQLEAYHRLTSMNDDDDPFTLANSIKNLAAGLDRGEYYRATGASLGRRSRGTSIRTSVGGFVERQRPVEATTDFSVRGLLRDDSVRRALAAEPIDVVGVRGLLGGFAGTDPTGWIFTGEVRAEAGFGDAQYRRAEGRLSLSHPLFLGLAGALEAGGGTSWGALPVQRSFFLGGSRTLRGFYVNQRLGPAFWRGRAEVATAFAGARLGVFSDVGWVGPREAVTFDDPLASVGVGVSLLDGLLRFDLARAVRGSDRWTVHLYLDALF